MYLDYPFDVTYIEGNTPGSYTLTAPIGLASYGLNAGQSVSDVNVKVAAVSYYPNNGVKMFSTLFSVEQWRSYDLSFSVIPDAFSADDELGMPQYVEAFIVPAECRPMKWLFTLEE